MPVDLSEIPPEPKRDRWNRYVVTTPDGETVGYTRATTIAKTLEDTYMLNQWTTRQSIKGVVEVDAYRSKAEALDPNVDKKEFNKLAETAKEWATASLPTGSHLGTALHRFTEDVDSGRKKLIEIPERWQEHVALYQRTLKENGLSVVKSGIEKVLLLDTYRVAGTSDRAPLKTKGGVRIVGDLKCGNSLDWSAMSIAIQLWIYANNEGGWSTKTNRRLKRTEMEKSRGIGIHLPANRLECTLYEYDLDYGFDCFLEALEVRELRKKAKKHVKTYKPDTDPVDLREWIAGRIGRLLEHDEERTIIELGARWPQGLAAPLPDVVSAEHIDQLSAAVDLVETMFELPFPATRP